MVWSVQRFMGGLEGMLSTIPSLSPAVPSGPPDMRPGQGGKFTYSGEPLGR